MQPIDAYNAAIARANHLLKLYDLFHDTRQRTIRSDWTIKFNEVMHWPKEEKISRIDGLNQNSIIIIRESLGITRSEFTQQYLSELLRSSVVASVSALDRYLHDIVVQYCISLLSKSEDNIPKELKKLQIPVLTTKLALEKKTKSAKSKPGYLLKLAIQEQLHREFTFQKPDDIIIAIKMLGIDDFWNKVSTVMNGNPKVKDIMSNLRKIVTRRNQIVHESDITRKIKAKKCTLRDISRKDAGDYVNWIDIFVKAANTIITRDV